MISIGRTRPSIPEYPEIANHIKQVIDEIYYGLGEPKQALEDAVLKSVKTLDGRISPLIIQIIKDI
jgi:multiple sugar transport system substrate-binding protein